MATFNHDAELSHPLDWSLLQNGAVSLYYRPEVLAEDAEWLATHNYRLDRFDCSRWHSEAVMHEALAAELSFPDYYGRNLDAFNDCLSDLDIPEEGGRVLIFDRFDLFAARFPETAWKVLDIIEHNSRRWLLFGRRFFALVQSDDARLAFDSVGGHAVRWNPREWLNASRGL